MRANLYKSFGVCLISLMLVAPVIADDVSHAKARALREAGKILSLEEIIQTAKSFKDGQIIETKLEKDDGLYEYDIEILDVNGRVWEMEFDAATGEIMQLELDD